NLYVGYENIDPDLPDILSGGYTNNSVQTFMAKDPEEIIKGYFTNPDADKFFWTQEPGSSPVSGTTSWETSAQMRSDSWNVVQAIPFSSIDVDPNQDKRLWSFFFRTYHHSTYIGWGGGSPWEPLDLNPINLVDE